MAEAMHTQASLREMAERLENCIDEKMELKLAELAGSLKHTLSESLKMAVDERLAAKDKEDVSSSWQNRAIQGCHDGNGASSDRFTHYAAILGYQELSFLDLMGIM